MLLSSPMPSQFDSNNSFKSNATVYSFISNLCRLPVLISLRGYHRRDFAYVQSLMCPVQLHMNPSQLTNNLPVQPRNIQVCPVNYVTVTKLKRVINQVPSLETAERRDKRSGSNKVKALQGLGRGD